MKYASPNKDDLAIAADSWLSRVLELDCYKVSISSILSYLEWRVQNPFNLDSFLSIKTKFEHVDKSEYFGTDLRFIQVMNQYVWSSKPQKLKFDTYKVREMLDVDLHGLLAVARNSFKQSRFHVDTRFTVETAEEIKKQWLISNLTSRRKCKNLVLVDNCDQILGFNSILIDRDQLVIDLISVDKKYRGLGLGKLLVSCSQSMANDFNVPLVVGTQQGNEANFLYRKMGFELAQKLNVWHDFLKVPSENVSESPKTTK